MELPWSQMLQPSKAGESKETHKKTQNRLRFVVESTSLILNIVNLSVCGAEGKNVQQKIFRTRAL
jgi:hypothetical protein